MDSKIIGMAEAQDIIYATTGQIFSVTFRKRTTGEFRKMVARLGVKKGVNGKGMSFDPATKHVIPVYDIQKKDFRMINAESIVKLKFGGIDYKVRDAGHVSP